MILKLKVWLLKKLLNDVSKHGHDGDVYLAHINKFEDKLLKTVGGEGSINPDTGLVQYKGGGGGGNSNTTQEIDPNVVPYVRDALSQQKKLYHAGAPEYYAGQTYLDPSKASSDAMNMGMAQARAGNPYLSQAQDTVGGLQSAVNPALAGYKDLQGNTITTGMNEALAGYRALQGGNVNGALAGTQATARGDFLQNNPNFNAVMDSAGKKVTDMYNTATQNTASNVSQAGRYGSNAHARLQAGNAGKLATSLADTAGQYAYQNYATERANQNQAMQNAGNIANNQNIGAQNLMNAGNMQAGFDQTALNADIARHDYGQNAQQQHLGNYINSVWGAPMGSKSTTSNSGGGK